MDGETKEVILENKKDIENINKTLPRIEKNINARIDTQCQKIDRIFDKLDEMDNKQEQFIVATEKNHENIKSLNDDLGEHKSAHKQWFVALIGIVTAAVTGILTLFGKYL